MFCSITVRVAGVEVQLSRVQGRRVLKPVLKSAGEPDAVGDALVAQGVSSLDDIVHSFNVCLLDAHSGTMCIISQN